MAVAKAKWYRGEPYWLKEEPLVAETERVRLRFFRRAGKLQVAALVRSREGRRYCVKAVTLHQEDLALHPEAADCWKGCCGSGGEPRPRGGRGR